MARLISRPNLGSVIASSLQQCNGGQEKAAQDRREEGERFSGDLGGRYGAAIGFFLGFRLAVVLHKKPALPSPAMSRAQVQDLRATALALEAKVEKLEREMKVPRRNQAL
jgi:hypothetical protein